MAKRTVNASSKKFCCDNCVIGKTLIRRNYYATNKYDEQGKKRGIGSRIGGAAKETVFWGPLRPLAMAHLTTVELPKMTKDIIKGF